MVRFPCFVIVILSAFTCAHAPAVRRTAKGRLAHTNGAWIIPRCNDQVPQIVDPPRRGPRSSRRQHRGQHYFGLGNLLLLFGLRRLHTHIHASIFAIGTLRLLASVVPFRCRCRSAQCESEFTRFGFPPNSLASITSGSALA